MERRARAPARPSSSSDFAVIMAPSTAVQRDPPKGDSRSGRSYALSHLPVKGTEFGLPVVSVRQLPGSTTASGKSGKGKSRTASGGASGKAAGDVDEDTELLDALLASSKRCGAVGCAAATHVIGSTCRHCNLRFCYEHGMPEVHGCGDAARAAARLGWKSGGAAAAAGAAPSRLSEAQRRTVENQLHKKLDAAAERRTAAAKLREKTHG